MRKLLVVLLLVASFAQARTYIIPIEGTIDGPLATFVEQSLNQAEREGASGVVFRVNTPGGRVDAAIRITDRILSSTVPTLAVVENAFSAGALISLAAQQIMMLPGSNIGAALPVTITPIVGNTNAADRKVISALKGKFRAVAEARGRPANLAEAMVDPEVEVRGITTKGEPSPSQPGGLWSLGWPMPRWPVCERPSRKLVSAPIPRNCNQAPRCGWPVS